MMWMLQKMQIMRKMSPQMHEETEEPRDEEEINELASGENQFQETNNTDESKWWQWCRKWRTRENAT